MRESVSELVEAFLNAEDPEAAEALLRKVRDAKIRRDAANRAGRLASWAESQLSDAIQEYFERRDCPEPTTVEGVQIQPFHPWSVGSVDEEGCNLTVHDCDDDSGALLVVRTPDGSRFRLTVEVALMDTAAERARAQAKQAREQARRTADPRMAVPPTALTALGDLDD